MLSFSGKILIIGYGSVSRCTLPLLFKHIHVPHNKVTIIDFADKRDALCDWTSKGLHYVKTKITPDNLNAVLSKYVGPGDMIIDLAWNIGALEILTWCHDHRVLYINTSIEEWEPNKNDATKPIVEKSLYHRHMKLRASGLNNPAATTAILDHGANPGLISHFTKQGLMDIAKKALRDKGTPKKIAKALEKNISDHNFPQLAMILGVKTIHCSERDTQITNQPKQVNEFVNTWSIEGLREEGTTCAEIGWGTHESILPANAHRPKSGPKNQIFLAQMGINTHVRSWVPDQEIIGMVIRHGEAFGISDRLTVWDGKKAIYRPTVHYAYMLCDQAIASLHELRARNYQLQPAQRIMNDEITSGEDILGALLMGHQYNSWWTGSILSIKESRKLVPHQNATTLQVAISVVAAAMWMIENTEQGLCLPDDLPHDYILKIAKPYLGEFVSKPSSWTPLDNHRIHFKENKKTHQADTKNLWSFDNFLFKP